MNSSKFRESTKVLFHRGLFRALKQQGEKRIVLDCDVERIPEILKQAQQVGMLTEEQSFILTSLVSLVCQISVSVCVCVSVSMLL